MNTKVLWIAVVIFLGLVVGLMFGGIQQNLAISQQLALQQGELIDLLRTVVKQSPSEVSLSDLEKKIDAMALTMMRAAPSAAAQQQRPPQPPPEDYDTVHEIPVGEAGVKGRVKAPVTIVGFLDLQCPFSTRFQPVINEVLAAYPGKVNYVVKHFPLSFHPQARPAAKAVIAAGKQGKYFEMMELVMENNKTLSTEKFLELAKTLKLNAKTFEKDLAANDQAWEKLINEDFVLGQKAGVQGTPTYYLNGKKTRARTAEMFKQEIDAILNKK